MKKPMGKKPMRKKVGDAPLPPGSMEMAAKPKPMSFDQIGGQIQKVNPKEFGALQKKSVKGMQAAAAKGPLFKPKPKPNVAPPKGKYRNRSVENAIDFMNQK